MDWLVALIVTLAIPAIVLPVVLIWYLNVSGVRQVIRDGRERQESRDRTLREVEELIRSRFLATGAATETASPPRQAAAPSSGVAIDCHPPAEICRRVQATGVTKAKLDFVSTLVLGVLAGFYIGLGAEFCTLVTTNTGLGFGITKLLGGLVFCLGLILVVVAGSELFTGNNLLTVAWASGKVDVLGVARNWGIVYAGNLAGALLLVALMYYAQQWTFANYAVGVNALSIANGKVNLPFEVALARGILCNALVCLAVWMCFSGRGVVDKILAIIFPITAFVASGFEHSIANMYFIPIGILMSQEPTVVQAAGMTAAQISNLTVGGFIGNLVPVTIGNIIGGGIIVGAAYWLAYLRREGRAEAAVLGMANAAAGGPSASAEGRKSG